ncbi:MAG: DUF4065 domain-containing protein [Sutterellaceae bacterium]|nr:DUF4065 domain-containing protein [Sutterellaceae bacterium]
MFDIPKATHVAAYILWKNDGRMTQAKLLLLMYLAEKQFLLRYGERLTGDSLVSTESGPGLSSTYACFCSYNKYSNQWITKPNPHDLALNPSVEVRREDPLDTFDELSVADQGILDSVYESCGTVPLRELKEMLIHPVYCPEWTRSDEPSSPINIADLLRKNGITQEQTDATLKKLMESEDFLTATKDLQT